MGPEVQFCNFNLIDCMYYSNVTNTEKQIDNDLHRPQESCQKCVKW
jgi:hypothetical protein